MIKVLQLVGGGSAIGGVERMLLNYYTYMDRDLIHFDFCFYRQSTITSVHNELEDIVKEAKIYDLRLFDKNNKIIGLLKSIFIVKSILKKNEYDIVHINAGRPPLLVCGLIAALLAGTRIKITHSHSTKGVSSRSKFSEILYEGAFCLIRPFLRHNSTYLAACSKWAAQYMFGNKIVDSYKYRQIRNAIIVEPFVYDIPLRKQVREELKVNDDTIVIGHIGSFSIPKNHHYILKVFEAIKKSHKNCVLWLAGNGDTKKDVEEIVMEMGLVESVFFLGERSDVNRLYQGMDMLLFPSLWEGLSVTLVEAQASALPVFTSTNISPEHKITDRIKFIDLNKGAEYWANYILKEFKKMPERKDMTDVITESGYNIKVEASALQSFYLESVK